jgi:hypothetical protein
VSSLADIISAEKVAKTSAPAAAAPVDAEAAGAGAEEHKE